MADREIHTLQIKMPEGEDLVTDTPTDAIGRYVLVLRQWEDLTRRQAKYEDDLRKLHATGDALSAEWERLSTARQQSVEALSALDTPSHEVIERAWTLFKADLFVLCQNAKRQRSGMSSSTPFAIEQLAEPITRNPRLT